MSTPITAAAPTRVRLGVLGFACSLAAITYLDRACFGTAEAYIREPLGLSDISDLTAAIAAFNLAYALFEVPAGWLGDVFGPRLALIRVVLWWSLFTAVTAFIGVIPAFGLGMLVVVRFLFGMGEAGAFPNITRALHNWFPVAERGSAQGAVWMSARLVGGLTPLIWTAIVVWAGIPWRFAFILFGVIGVLWCIAFARRFRNRPEESADVNPEELAWIRSSDPGGVEPAKARVPWTRLLKNRNLWALCVMYFLMSYGWYFNINFLPACLETLFDVPKESFWGAIGKGGPLIVGAIGCVLGGWLTDSFIQRTGNRRWGRRVFGMAGHALCIPLYIAAINASSAPMFAVCIALTGFCNDLAIGSAWATCQDIGRRHAAIVAGCMNTIGNLGGFASATIIGWLLRISRERYLVAHQVPLSEFGTLPWEAKRAALLPGYEWNLASFAGVYVVAIGVWLVIDATKPVLSEDGPAGMSN
jgi:MFS transporter, ACS family, glucarate transporter